MITNQFFNINKLSASLFVCIDTIQDDCQKIICCFKVGVFLGLERFVFESWWMRLCWSSCNRQIKNV